MAFVIEKGVPINDRGVGVWAEFYAALYSMVPSDSFFVKERHPYPETLNMLAETIREMRKEGRRAEFTWREVRFGIRIWRVS